MGPQKRGVTGLAVVQAVQKAEYNAHDCNSERDRRNRDGRTSLIVKEVSPWQQGPLEPLCCWQNLVDDGHQNRSAGSDVFNFRRLRRVAQRHMIEVRRITAPTRPMSIRIGTRAFIRTKR